MLRNDQLMKAVAGKEWSAEDTGHIASTLVDVASSDAAVFLAKYLENNTMADNKTQLAYQQVIRFIPAAQIKGVIRACKRKKEC